jgi:L-ascorbate metabolism protein UlaG (beta-lactamase superfamily)
MVASVERLEHLGAGAYRCGRVRGIHLEVAGTTLYHQGSADLIDGEYREGPVDVFLCGIAGRVCSPRFTARALRAVRPRIVVPHHHDDFFRPLEGPMGFSFNVHLAGFVEEVDALVPDVAVRTLDPLRVVTGG